jgi:hypothetical protein
MAQGYGMRNNTLERVHTVKKRWRYTNHFALGTPANTQQFNVTDDLNDLRPFRNDDRISEEGLVAETVIHKNVILADMHTNITMRTMPFGMRADRWPGIFDGDGNTVKATAARHGIKFSTSYAIPMSVSVAKMVGGTTSY